MNVGASFHTIVREWRKVRSPNGSRVAVHDFGGFVTDDAGRQVTLTKAMEKEIHTIADWLRDQRPATKSQYTVKEWRSFVRSSFATPITCLKLNRKIADNGEALRNAVENAIDSSPITVTSSFMTIGCTLFDPPLTVPLQIGPVRFESKPEWLKRLVADKQIAPAVCKRLSRGFAGKRLAKVKSHRQNHDERAVLDVLLSAQLVCTVEINGLAFHMAEERAIIGARLAQTALALLWRLPSSPMEEFHLSVDPAVRTVRTLFFTPGSQRIAGGNRWKGSRRGQSIHSMDLSKLLSDARALLDVAGKTIECWTSASAYDKAPEILRTLAQAIFLFSEACREEYAPMAIVKYTATLDALVQGKQSKGIKALCKARLRTKPNAKVYKDKDMDAVIEWLYSAGRSRTVHGTRNADILHDWSEDRGLAELLARHCLVACMDFYQQNPTAIPKDLLAAPASAPAP